VYFFEYFHASAHLSEVQRLASLWGLLGWISIEKTININGMKKLYGAQLLSLCWILALTSCGGGSVSEEGRIARDICACMQPLADAYTELQKAMDEGDAARAERVSEGMKAVKKEVRQCAEQVEGRYGPMGGEREAAVKSAMQEHCPETIATLNRAEDEMVQ